MKRLLAAALAIAVLACVVGLYGLMLVLSESRTYSAPSLEHLLLTPNLFKDLPFTDLSDARYAYSAADGPKPAISSVAFTAREDRASIERRISDYLVVEGFHQTSPGSFVKDRREVQVEYRQRGSREVEVSLTDFDPL